MTSKPRAGMHPPLREACRRMAADAMVAYAYDTAMRRNPVGFFGMVFVLEGASVALACNAADRIQATLATAEPGDDLSAQSRAAGPTAVHDLYAILNRLEAGGGSGLRPSAAHR